MSLEIDAAVHGYVYGKKKIRAGISESQQRIGWCRTSEIKEDAC